MTAYRLLRRALLASLATAPLAASAITGFSLSPKAVQLPSGQTGAPLYLPQLLKADQPGSTQQATVILSDGSRMRLKLDAASGRVLSAQRLGGGKIPVVVAEPASGALPSAAGKAAAAEIAPLTAAPPAPVTAPVIAAASSRPLPAAPVPAAPSPAAAPAAPAAAPAATAVSPGTAADYVKAFYENGAFERLTSEEIAATFADPEAQIFGDRAVVRRSFADGSQAVITIDRRNRGIIAASKDQGTRNGKSR